MIERGDHWPETVYRYVEHSKWEPQHLCPKQSVNGFLKRSRRQEPRLGLDNVANASKWATYLTLIDNPFYQLLIATIHCQHGDKLAPAGHSGRHCNGNAASLEVDISITIHKRTDMEKRYVPFAATELV